jgi:hypothetical protein
LASGPVRSTLGFIGLLAADDFCSAFAKVPTESHFTDVKSPEGAVKAAP